MLLRTAASPELSTDEQAALRRLLDEAFEGDFTEADWQHALGGSHAVLADGPVLVAHAAVVPRRIEIASRWWHAGYVEAVAVVPARWRTGLGTAVMARANDLIRERFDLGVLSTSAWRFYQRLGWERWQGPTWVVAPDGSRRRTADEDDGIMVLRTDRTGAIDPTAAIACEERTGDSW